ncbi:ATP synthase F1 subunit delta [Candidatus Zixiibacteriota bacterium]
MLSQEVAKKYANALFLSVKEKNLTDVAYEQFNSLKELITKDKTLISFLSAPQVLDENKLALVKYVFTPRIERLFVEFLTVLVDKNRINFLSDIIDEFDRLVEAEKGIGRVTVITAIPLNDSQRALLNQSMTTKTGLKIVLEEKVDPQILGGMIVILHNEIIDGSVRHGLDMIAEKLNKVRVH